MDVLTARAFRRQHKTSSVTEAARPPTNILQGAMGGGAAAEAYHEVLALAQRGDLLEEEAVDLVPCLHAARTALARCLRSGLPIGGGAAMRAAPSCTFISLTFMHAVFA